MINFWNNYAKGQLPFPLKYWVFDLGENIVIYFIAVHTDPLFEGTKLKLK